MKALIPNINCISSSDMKNRTDHGSVFRATEGTTWAPAAVERDGMLFKLHCWNPE